jgi:flagellar biosynthesis chaperone FliJ
MKKQPAKTKLNKLMDRRAEIQKRLYQAMSMGMSHGVLEQLNIQLAIIGIDIEDEAVSSNDKDNPDDGEVLDIG